MFQSTEQKLQDLLSKNSKLAQMLIISACELALVLNDARGGSVDQMVLKEPLKAFSQELARVIEVHPGFEIMSTKPIESALEIVEFWLLKRLNSTA